MVRGWGALYDTAIIICRGCENGQGVHYMTQQKLCVRGCENGQGGECII